MRKRSGSSDLLQGQATRRHFLQAAGTMLALPLFDSLLPRNAQAADPPKRLITYFCPVGMWMPSWTPATTGPAYTLSDTLMPLKNVQSKLLVLSNTVNSVAYSNIAGDHARGTAAFATGSSIALPGAALNCAASVDQIAAPILSAGLSTKSLQLSLPAQHGVDGDSSYSTSYNASTSWANATTQLPPQTQPAVIFKNFYQGANSALSAAAQAQRVALRKSVLDDVTAQTQTLLKRLGSADQQKLDQYFTGLRQMEQSLLVPANASCNDPNGATLYTSATDTKTVATQLTNLMILAFHCDLTRVISFMFGPGESEIVYDFLSDSTTTITNSHHTNSHHNEGPGRVAQLQVINKYEMTMLASLLEGLDAVPDIAGGGTLLDNTILVCSSELSTGQNHDHVPMPLLVAGGGGKTIKLGQHYSAPDNTDMASVWLTCLHALGINAASFGSKNISATIPGIL